MYFVVCTMMNMMEVAPTGRLSIDRAKQIIASEQQSSYLKDKKINFIPASRDSFPSTTLQGFMYSSRGEYNIVIPGNTIDKKTLLHEVAHTLFSEPNTTNMELSFRTS